MVDARSSKCFIIKIFCAADARTVAPASASARRAARVPGTHVLVSAERLNSLTDGVASLTLKNDGLRSGLVHALLTVERV